MMMTSHSAALARILKRPRTVQSLTELTQAEQALVERGLVRIAPALEGPARAGVLARAQRNVAVLAEAIAGDGVGDGARDAQEALRAVELDLALLQNLRLVVTRDGLHALARRRATAAHRRSMMSYRLTGRAGTTAWYPSPHEAWAAYVRRARRQGLPDPGHIPGTVAGDAHEPGRTQGVLAGHGVVYLESR